MERTHKYKGKILVSRPVLNDDFFNRTVLVVVEDNEWGTIGFILNKPMDSQVHEFIFKLNSESTVYEGGPVHPHKLFYIHSRPDLIKDSIQISEDYYWSGNFNDVKESIASDRIKPEEIRFFLGYSGWENGQLDDEFKENAWMVMENNFDLLADWNVNLWKRQLKILGGENLLWLNMPENPLLN